MIIRFLIAVLLLQAFTVIPCEAIKLEDIEIVRYDPSINNSAIYNFSLKQPSNEDLTKDAKFQITDIVTQDYLKGSTKANLIKKRFDRTADHQYYNLNQLHQLSLHLHQY